ncbi:YbaK/proline-tRNA ligase associated domain containing protein [Acanthamoeba castellanii str. Neff]|uniref:YbaK/proline-tRNA ligase associated domain containing protein n=1 Tax=Acanthamoeba castellanii (strain ATCC 30010 / Neff) TaxID=1257118 RepID=L8HIQ9_ACACF|nr:YbaK/proline-tRNA ligase associated domain containing protein [Acanthamoeba castellanii str. Neff]ELR24291.1 YbaK/proline-tRNA ligase associated domain containing protein [Acanthamoeba castellanii str. Neff]
METEMMSASGGALPQWEAMLLSRQEDVLRLLEQLLERVRRAEEVLAGVPKDDEPVARVKQAARALPIPSAAFRRVPSTYYEWPLTRRRRCLGAPSVHQVSITTLLLCKTIMLENTHCTRTGCSDPRNSRYYAVIIQYTTRLQSQKVFKFVRKLNPEISKKHFKFRLAPEEISDQLTGFGKGAVCPVGMNTPIPVILSDRLTRLSPQFMWLGGGHIDVKLGCNVTEFITATKCYVADIVYDEASEAANELDD